MDGISRKKSIQRAQGRRSFCCECNTIFSQNDPRSCVWYSAIFQAAAALSVVQSKYSFKHNDCHSENVRVKKINEACKLYYQDEQGVYAVDTNGYLLVLIDFGRATLRPVGEQEYASSVFAPRGECR